MASSSFSSSPIYYIYIYIYNFLNSRERREINNDGCACPGDWSAHFLGFATPAARPGGEIQLEGGIYPLYKKIEIYSICT